MCFLLMLPPASVFLEYLLQNTRIGDFPKKMAFLDLIP